MNNKDLFNAINDIDDKFITDAGKHLKKDHIADFSRYGEPVEVHPAEGKFSPWKIVAPIAAAAILVTSVTIALKTRNIFNTAPYAGNETASDVAVGAAESGTSNVGGIADSPTSDGKTSLKDPDTAPAATEKNDMTGDLPFTLYGPDYRQITYEEITHIDNNVAIQYLNDSNWSSINCDGFAYIVDPGVGNYNIADQPEMFLNSAWNTISSASNYSDFRRIYVGDRYGDLTVDMAYSTFWRTPTNGMTEQQMDENGFPKALLYNGGAVHFSGTVTANVYIVRQEYKYNNGYFLVFRNGESPIPIPSMSIDQTAVNNDKFKPCMSYGVIDGFEYATEAPSIRISADREDMLALDKYFDEKNCVKAVVRLSDIMIRYSPDLEGYSTDATVTAISIQLSDDDTEPQDISRIIDSTETVEELMTLENEINEKKENPEYSRYFRIYSYVKDFGDHYIDGDEIYDGELYPGMTVAMCDQDGTLNGIYTYRIDEIRE